MNNKKRICPYCGAETFQHRTIRHTLVIDESDGEIISNNHEDFHTCRSAAVLIVIAGLPKWVDDMDDKLNVFNACGKFPEEEWRPIEGYESYYSVSNLGRVWSHRSNRALKPIISKAGYARVHLAVSGKTATAPIHRLVATAFIPNPDNKPTVNHLNEIKTDNRVENLAWATYLEQNVHGTRIQRVVAHTDWEERTKKIDYKLAASKYDHHATTWKQMRAVLQFDLSGNFIACYDSINGAANALNISAGHICCCLKGRRKSCGGYTWEYA